MINELYKNIHRDISNIRKEVVVDFNAYHSNPTYLIDGRMTNIFTYSILGNYGPKALSATDSNCSLTELLLTSIAKETFVEELAKTFSPNDYWLDVSNFGISREYDYYTGLQLPPFLYFQFTVQLKV